jgi:hypothetical protein
MVLAFDAVKDTCGSFGKSYLPMPSPYGAYADPRDRLAVQPPPCLLGTLGSFRLELTNRQSSRPIPGTRNIWRAFVHIVSRPVASD